MADSLLTALQDLRTRIEAMNNEMALLREHCADLEAERDEYRRQAQEAISARERAELDIEYLRVSHKLADSPQSLIETRRRIAGLIRNIDRCIDLLKE